MSTPVHAVVTPLNTCRASRARRDEHVASCCPTSATQHVTTFFYAKIHGLDRVTCHDVTRQVEFGLYCSLYSFRYQRSPRSVFVFFVSFYFLISSSNEITHVK